MAYVDRSDEINFKYATATRFQPGYFAQPRPAYYWQEPQRVARYYNAIKTLPPGATVPTWVDQQGITTAYNYLRARNNDQPWYTWRQLPDDDPGHEVLKNVGMPPPEAMPLPERQQYYNPAFSKPISNQDGYYPIQMEEARKYFDPASIASMPKQGEQVLIPSSYVDNWGKVQGFETLASRQQYGGMTKEQYDALQPWQKAVIGASPWFNTAVGAGGGALAGAAIGGIPGALIGGVAGGLLARSAEQGIDPETGQPKSGAEGDIARLTNSLGQGAVWLEQGTGVLGQLASSIADPDRYGPVQEVLKNLGSAWEAGKVTYPVAFADITGKQITPMSMIGQPAGETWTVPEGAFASSLALTEGRRRIAAGERPEDVLNDIRARFGIAGTAREMLGQMFLDPMNLMGDVVNGVGYAAAKRAGNVPLAESFLSRSQLAILPENLKRAFTGEMKRNPVTGRMELQVPLLDAGNMYSNDIVDALKVYGMKLRQMPIEEAVQFGAVSRWIAGLDKAGNLAELTSTPRGGMVGIYDRLRGLTPQARAHEVLAQGVDGLQVLLAQEEDPNIIFGRLQQIAKTTPSQAVEALADNPLPKWFSSAEGQGVTAAMKDAMPKARDLHDRWLTTRDQATILQRVADAMGEDVYKLLGDLHNAKPEEANTIYRAFLQRLQKLAAGDPANGIPADATAAKLLATIQGDTSLARLDGARLKEFGELFTGQDGAPFSADQYKAQMFHLLTENLEGWAVSNFKVKPAHWAYRTADLVKRAQGKVLLGLNPTFLLNNAINNLVTLGWDGLLEFSTAKSRMRFLRELGVKPARLRSGATAAEIGEDVLSAQDLGGYELGRQIRKASRAGDIIQGMDDILRKADKFPDFATLSQKFERYSSELATVNAMRRYWPQVWRDGGAITKMTPDLAAALDAVDPGLSKKVMRAIERGKSKAEIEKIVFKDLGRPSIQDVLTRQEKDLLANFPGLVDDLDDELGRAKTDEDIRAAFAGARSKVQAGIKAQVARNMARMTAEAAEKVKIEGGQGVLDLFDGQQQSRHDFDMMHFEKMAQVAEEAQKHSGPARSAIWQKAFQEEDEAYNQFENIEGSKWLGAFEGLGAGKDDPEYIDALNTLTGQHSNYRAFYDTRRQLMTTFADRQGDLTDVQSAALWAEINQQLNQEYVRMILTEDALQSHLDELFVTQYARQFADNPNAGAEAAAWRGAVQNVRQRMAATMALFRTGGQMPPELEGWFGMLPPEITNKVMDLTKGIPPFAMGNKVRQEVSKRFYTEVYTPYIREALEASNQNAPGQIRIPPAEMPIAPAGAAPAEPPIAAAEQPAQVPVMITRDMRQQLADLGYSPDDISQMTPQQAWDVINGQQAKANPPAAQPEVTAPAEPATTGEAGAPPEPAAPAPAPEDLQAAEAIRQATETARANLQGVYKVAADNGIGSQTPGQQKHILNILKQYYRVDDISQVTPEMARQAFERRSLFKGAIDLEAQQALDKRIVEFRAQQIRDNQRKMELASPKTFTRDALFREAEEQFGSEQADAFMVIQDALAQHWTEQQPGRTTDQWYERQVWEHGGFEGGAGLAQAGQDWYYSQLLRVTDSMPNRITVDQLRGFLRGKVKDDEMRWTGFDDWLSERDGPVSKADVQRFLRENQLQVKEVVREEYGTDFTAPEIVEEDGQFVVYIIDDYDERNPTAWFDTRAEAEEEVDSIIGSRPRTRYDQYRLPGGQNYRELLITLPGERQRTYRSPHWEEPNVLSHIRFTDRIDAEGKKVLFIEEIQSDWHQAGREKGYVPTKPEPIDTTGWVVDPINDSNLKFTGQRDVGIIDQNGSAFYARYGFRGTDAELIADAVDYLRRQQNENRVPAAPFAKNWEELSLKRAIRWAAESDYDRVAWTTGEMQAERYSLANEIDALRWQKRGNNIELFGDKGKGTIWHETVPSSRLHEYVGVDIAKQIQGSEYRRGSIEGEGLKVGGEGMKAAYDQRIPSIANRYIKKWGGEVKDITIYPDSSVSGELVEFPGMKKYTVQGFDVTPVMRESVMQGQALFQSNKGVTRFLENGQALVHAFDSADISTFVHETAHVWLPQMERKDLDTVATWLKAEYGLDLPEGWEQGHENFVQAKEYFARGFERYLTEGRAPIPSMRAVFEKFKKWLVSIYQNITGSQIDIKLNDEIIGLFDEWMGKKPEPAAVAPEPASPPYRVLINEVGADGLTAAERSRLATPPAVTPEMPVSPIEKPTFQRNAAHQGIEIKFPEKPDDATLSWLHQHKYKYSRHQNIWYKKEAAGDWDAAGRLFGTQAAPTAPEPPAQGPKAGPLYWITWDEWQRTHNKARLEDYQKMIRLAVESQEIGYDDALGLIGKNQADWGMYNRIIRQAETLTKQQFLDAIEPYAKVPRRELEISHRQLVHEAVLDGKNVPDEILRDYPDLYIAKAPPETPPASVMDGVEPKLFNAPEGQMSLFGEETAGFGLQAERAPAETFNPPASQQPGLFGLGEFTEAPKKPVPPAKEGPAGPLFEQPAIDKGKLELERTRLEEGLRDGELRLRAKKNAIGQRLTPSEIDMTQRSVDSARARIAEIDAQLGAASPEVTEPARADFRAAVRQMLLDYLTDNPGSQRGLMPRIFDVQEVPGFGKVNLHDVVQQLGGVDNVKPLFDEVWDLTHKPQPPITEPITIQPDGIGNAIDRLAAIFSDPDNAASVIPTGRHFETFMQQVMGLDLNDEKNLNLAYDALEGAFNKIARNIRADLDARNASTSERLQAMADLESRLLRARRTIAKSKLQQFSTPLSISEAAGIAADVRAGDVLTEPTAGTANLVDRFYGRGDITVKVNEFDPGRRDVLRAIGYDPTDLDVLSAAWVIGPDGRKLPPMASTAIINPPWGAYSTGKYGTAVNVPVKMNDWSQRFTYLILQRMADNSRLVGVMPTNWEYTLNRATREISLNKSDFLRWLEQNYWVRAIIESPPDAYKQRGTDIGSLLVVVDKTRKPDGALPAIEAWGEKAPKTWDEYAALVDQLRKGGTHERSTYDIRTSQASVERALADELNARRPVSGPDATGLVDPNARSGNSQPAADRIGQPSLGDAQHTAGSVGDLFTNRGAVLPSGRNRVGPAGELVTERPATGPAVERPNPSGRSGGAERGNAIPANGSSGRPEPGAANAPAPTGEAGPAGPGLVEGQPAGVQPGVSEPVSPVEQPVPQLREELPGGAARGSQPTTAAPEAPEGAGRVDDAGYQRQWREQVTAVERAGAFTGYVGRSAGYLAGEPTFHHPSLVVETKALAGVKYPDLEEAYKPSAGVLDAYRRGDLSIEGQLDPVWAAVQQNDKYGMGMLIADDVGMGKSRTAAAYALDRIERGKKKILVITKNRDNINNLMQSEFPLIFGEGKARFQEISGDTLPNAKKGGEAIPFYNEPTVYFLPASQFADFEGPIHALNVDAVIVDEAHVFKNVDETAIGQAWTNLHTDWNRRGVNFLYLTATPATDLMEMKYLYGLKLWTTDGFGDWIGVITGKITPEQAKKAGDAAKSMGEYITRLEAAAREQLGATKGIKVNGTNEIGYEVKPGLWYVEGKQANTGAVWAGGERVAVKIYSGDAATSALIALNLGEVGPEDPARFLGMGDFSRKSYIEDAIGKVRRDFPPPKIDNETKQVIGIKDAGDALDVLDKKGRKKFGSNRSAFESTLPPEHTEQIMREMKLGGSYMSRDISRVGVEFDAKRIDLRPDQLARQNARIRLYRDVMEAYQKFGKMNKKPRMDPGVVGDIQADAKRAMFDLRLQQALPEVDAALARGEKVVVSIVSVSETDPKTGGHLRKAIESINQQRVEKVGEGEYSDPEDIPEAAIVKAELQEKAEAMGVLQSPLELLKAKYGDRIGFITGAQQTPERRAAMKAFQNNDLDVVVISGAGKTGINLHDINGQKQVHLMVVDYDWSATEFKQELGRVDRTGQKTAPKVTVFHTGNAGELKFISTITNRMKGLGATSKGGAESTGTASLNEQFELGSTYDKAALADTWRTTPREEKQLFIDRYFHERDDVKAAIPETAQSIKKVTLALQSMPFEDANRFADRWMQNRKKLLAEVQGEIAARAAMQRGEVLRTTGLANNLVLTEARDETGHRFGILSGVLTPYMHKIAGPMGGEGLELVNGELKPKQWREWIAFQNTANEDRIAGLIIPPGKIDEIARTFNTSVRSARSPATALQDMVAGDKLPVRGPDNAELSLYMGKGGFREGKIVVDGAKMYQKDPLMHNGAKYDARGNFFYVTEDRLQEFLRRFPLRDSDGLAQSLPPGQTFAFGPSGQRYNFKYRVVSLDDLIQSHLDTFDPNPKYPRELQPRARDRAAYREQVQQIASGLDERLLLETHQVDSGTPIIGNDLVVENGNGRVMALRRARLDYPDQWEGYQDNLRAKLGDYGLSQDDLAGIEDPVLVRERLDDVDRVKFAGEAQASQSMQLTVDEMAGTDARYVDDSALANLTINDEQSIEGALRSPANRELVNNFLGQIPAGEKGAFLAPDGSLSLDGLTRLRNAIFVHVYPGDAGRRLADAFLVSQSEAISNIRAAIFDTLAPMSQAEALIREGRRSADLSITDDIARAVDQYARLKQQGASVKDYVNQPGLLEKPTNAFQDRFLQYLDENSRSRKRLRELVALYADNVINVQQDPNQMALFGEARATKGEILDAAAEQITGRAGGFEEALPSSTQPEPAMSTSTAATPEPAVAAAIGAPADAVPAAEGSTEPARVPAVASPLGTAEQYHEPPVEEAAYEGWMKEVEPALRRAEAAMLDPNYRRTGLMDLNKDLDPTTKKALKKYLGQVGADLTDAKLATIRYGEMRRDAALLNYGARTGMDNLLSTIMPYEFWMTRSMQNWAIRAMARPSTLANWARLRNLQEKYTEGEGNTPTRLKKKVKIPMPFLPDWMGDGVYIDPLKQLFPFEQMARPWEELANQKNLETRKAESALDQMVQDEQITEQAAAQAKASHSGATWEKAVALARSEMDEDISNPLDFAFMMSGPSLPISIAYNLLSGNKDKISQLPITRLIQANTAALGIGGARGLNIEAPIRKAAGMPEVDRFEDYRVDRMLANLAAEGAIPADEAERAMIDRNGPAFEMAQRRVSEMGFGQYWGAPLGVDMFPEGERELRGLKTEYDAARAKWASGEDTKALTKFFDEHPEYETRSASFRDPTERLRRYLISEVWDRWGKLPSIHKDQVQEQLGPAFKDAFLDKETRSYDTIETPTLAQWAQALGAKNPEAAPDAQKISLELAPADVAKAVDAYYAESKEKFPQSGMVMQALYALPEEQRAGFEANYPQIQAYYKWKNRYLADHPNIIEWITSEKSDLYGLPADIQRTIYQYRADREDKFPGWNKVQEGYYALPKGDQRKAYLTQHPELKAYWTWKDAFEAANPEAAQAMQAASGTTSSVPANVQGYVSAFYRSRDHYFPGIMDTQDAYFNLGSKAEKKAFMKAHPELGKYWDWRKEMAALNTQAAPYILSTESMQKSIMGDMYDQFAAKYPQGGAASQVSLQMFTPATQRALAAAVYGGESLRPGVWDELETVWEKQGKPAGSLDKWVDEVVLPAVQNGD